LYANLFYIINNSIPEVAQPAIKKPNKKSDLIQQGYYRGLPIDAVNHLETARESGIPHNMKALLVSLFHGGNA